MKSMWILQIQQGFLQIHMDDLSYILFHSNHSLAILIEKCGLLFLRPNAEKNEQTRIFYSSREINISQVDTKFSGKTL